MSANGRFIPNENCWVGYAASISNNDSPSSAELAAAVTLTTFLRSINAMSQGQELPSEDLSTTFQTSVVGIANGQFSAEFYQDKISNQAWSLFPRGTAGYFLISRFGGTGTLHKPVTGQPLETWPIQVTSRGASPMTSGQLQTFTINCAITGVPSESAIVGA